jgi:hypothetical protein
VVSQSARAQSRRGVFAEYNPDLAALFAFAALHRVTGAAAALEQCRRLGSALAAPPSEAAATRLREELTCALRLAVGQQALPIDAGWSGCRCGFQGRVVGGACVDSLSADRRFTEEPIDQRMRAGLERLVRTLQHRIAPGLRLVQLGLAGCHEARVERGQIVRELAQQQRPEFDLRHVSEHAHGTACDLKYLRFEGGGRSFDFAVAAFHAALLDHLHIVGDPLAQSFQFQRTAHDVVARGEGRFYRPLEATLRSATMPLASDPDFQLRIGVILRNALVDSGFVVFDPLTNAAHRDHFHFHLPDDAERAARLARPDLADEERERLIDPDLRRAAGLN